VRGSKAEDLKERILTIYRATRLGSINCLDWDQEAANAPVRRNSLMGMVSRDFIASMARRFRS